MNEQSIKKIESIYNAYISNYTPEQRATIKRFILDLSLEYEEDKDGHITLAEYPKFN